MKGRLTLRLAAYLGLTAVALWPGCSPSAPPGSGGTGSVRMLITDRPFPFEFVQEALVTITRVEVHRVSADDSDDANSNADADANANAAAGVGDNSNGDGANANDAGDDGRPWLVLFDDPAGKSFNLLELRNGRTDLLADAELPAGTYNQMRLVVASGQVTLTDGRAFPLDVPSGDRTGIKLHFTFEVADGEETQLLLDVDLSRAFSPVPAGRIDDVSTISLFHFSPSVAMRLIHLLEAGSVSGTVTDAAGNPLADVSVTVFEDDTEVTSTATVADGTYTLGGLTTGTYRIEFSATGFADAEVAGVAVQAGETTSGVDAMLTAEMVVQP